MNKKLIISMAEKVGDPVDLMFDEEVGEPLELVKYRNFEWFRNKSNECVREKGFSFYYATTAYIDKHRMFDKDPNSPSHESRDLLVGHPYGDPSVSLLVVIHIKAVGDGNYRIISAYQADAGSWYETRYRANKDLQIRVSKRPHRKKK